MILGRNVSKKCVGLLVRIFGVVELVIVSNVAHMNSDDSICGYRRISIVIRICFQLLAVYAMSYV